MRRVYDVARLATFGTSRLPATRATMGCSSAVPEHKENTMRLPLRDVIATVLVAIGALIYMAWALGADLPVISSVEAVAVAVLVLGIAASASAVIPAFSDLIRGSRRYLAITSILGLIALASGALAILYGNPVALAALMLSTVGLWALATDRHTRGVAPQARPH
jgi:hypothetical protein